MYLQTGYTGWSERVFASGALALVCLLTTGVAQGQNTPPELYDAGAYRIGIGADLIYSARYMDVDSADNLYVAANGAVRKYDGTTWTVLTSGAGSASGNINSAMGVVVDDAGRVYVSAGAQVKRFLSDGSFDAEWTGLGFAAPLWYSPRRCGQSLCGGLWQ